MPVDNFKWGEDISEFGERFIKSYNEESDEGYFLEVGIQYPEHLHKTQNDLPFLLEKMKIGEAEKLVANLREKLNMLFT